MCRYPPPTTGFYVQNLLELTCNSLDDLMLIAAEGRHTPHIITTVLVVIYHYSDKASIVIRSMRSLCGAQG